MSYTYAILEVSQEVYDEIKAKLEEAGYCVSRRRRRPPDRHAWDCLAG